VSELRRMRKKSGRVTRTLPAQPPADATPAAPGDAGQGERRARTGQKRTRVLLYGAGAIVALAALVSTYLLVLAPGDSIRSMAVLPFVNQSGDPEMEFLSDGFTETLINRLSRLPGVRMMSRSSVFRFKGKDLDPAEAGASLGVQAVLTGRILHRDGQISVGVELVDVRDHSHIWGEHYVRRSNDVLTLQDEITGEISRQLRVTLSGEEKEVLARSATRDNEAYELYLKGRFHWNKRTREGFETAASYLRQAIERDPGFALAYAGLADCYSVMPSYFILSPWEAQSKARAAAEKALDLDPSMAEPYVTLGAITAEYDWEWEKGEGYFKRAIALNPNYATAHQWYGESMFAMGRLQESIAELRKAQELDPLSPIIAVSLGTGYALTARYDEAREEVRKALELDPMFPRALWLRALIRYLEGDAEGSIRELRELVSLTGGTDESTATLAYVLGKAGHRDEAATLTGSLVREAERRYVSPYLLAVCFTGLGDPDQAFAYLEKGFQERSTGVVYMRTDVLLNPLHGDPRFNAMLVAMGLKPLEK
jgi:TolB-like protein/tetratricopeptide (TPR) repeat protein